MTERKTWLEEEDKVLKMLVVERGLTKWAVIARIMADEFQITGRSGKQCRERYHNHLDQRIKHGPWSKQEEQLLIDLQNSLGNHWADISRAIAGRSENCVKNKFYSILRRGVKTLNTAIKKQFKKYKELEVSAIYKIVDHCEPTFSHQTTQSQPKQSHEIKRKLLYYGLLDDSFPFSRDEYLEIKKLIDRIRMYRKSRNQNMKSQQYLHSEEFSSKEGKEEEDVKVQTVESQSMNKRFSVIDLSKQPLRSLGLQPLQQEDPVQQQEPKPLHFAPRMSKKFSLLSNLSMDRRQSQNDMNHIDLLRRDSTIKSFEFPQFDHLRSPYMMLESPHFDQLRSGGNFNSWSYLFQH